MLRVLCRPALGLWVVGALLAGCSGAARPPTAPAAHLPTPPPSPPSAAASPSAAVDEGALPQTSASPSDDAAFGAEMAALWEAVTTGDAGRAAGAFFPLAAYRQIKTVSDPGADWHDRLLGGFAVDVAAAHDLVAAQGPGASLVRVDVPASYARWVRPGTCANRIGYWHLAQARVVYRSGGQLRSFGIASLISWRGTWYVVHLGAVLRHGTAGVVDQPATGAGRAGALGGC